MEYNRLAKHAQHTVVKHMTRRRESAGLRVKNSYLTKPNEGVGVALN